MLLSSFYSICNKVDSSSWRGTRQSNLISNSTSRQSLNVSAKSKSQNRNAKKFVKDDRQQCMFFIHLVYKIEICHHTDVKS